MVVLLVAGPVKVPFVKPARPKRAALSQQALSLEVGRVQRGNDSAAPAIRHGAAM